MEQQQMTFSFECGRLVVNRVEYILRNLAVREDVELKLDIRKGWIECFVYGTVEGSSDALRAYRVAVNSWLRENQS